MMRETLREIMRRAWALHRRYGELSFGECLHRSWSVWRAVPVNAERIEAARLAAGVTERVNTWAGWRNEGYEVQHGSRALFGCDLIYASRGDGAVYRARFFSESQVRPLEAA